MLIAYLIQLVDFQLKPANKGHCLPMLPFPATTDSLWSSGRCFSIVFCYMLAEDQLILIVDM